MKRAREAIIGIGALITAPAQDDLLHEAIEAIETGRRQASLSDKHEQ